jgi:ATP-dependent helicase/nuclease subunit A
LTEAVQLDAEARSLAQREYRRPVALEAGAGTGKTAVLVARVCVWCLGEGWERAVTRLATEAEGVRPERVAAEALRRVVAITFTEAAAAEMAVRVGRALLALQSGEPVVGIESDAVPANGEVLRERARALVGALDQLGVRTIHAFCRRLLSAHALDAGLHPRFQVDAGGGALEAVAREVMEAHLRRAYDEPGDADAQELAELGFGPPEVEAALLVLLREGVPAGRLQDPIGTEAAAGYLRELAAALTDFLATEDGAFSGQTASRAAQVAALAVGAALECVRAAAPSGEGLASLVAGLAEEVEAKHVGRLRDWGRGKLATKAEQEAWPGDVAPLLRAARAAHRWLGHALDLDPHRLALGHRVVAPLLAEARELLRRRGVETFTALLQDTEELLRLRSGVAARVRGEIDQLLVDEFQDTDALQCEILRRLALEGPPEEQPGLFVVGDPKQSIYGWRNADLRAYEEFTRRMAGAGGRRGALCVNHRSVQAVLDEVERVVEPAMQPEPGVQPAFERLVASEAHAHDPGFEGERAAPVEHWVSWEWDAEAGCPRTDLRASEAVALEARAVARDLARLHQETPMRWGSVALLFRSLADGDVYLDQLRRSGIPYVVERDRHYYDRREVIDASALVRALLDPHDQVALLAALRSSAVGVPDAAWVPLWERGFPERFAKLVSEGGEAADLQTIVRDAALAVPADVPGIERIAGWEECLAAFVGLAPGLRRSCAEDPPDVFVERLRSSLQFEVSEAARTLGHFRLVNLDRFFRDLRSALEGCGGDLARVLSALRHSVAEAREQEEGRPRPAADDAVRVLTIHGAKGLEFDHVYILQLHKSSGRAARDEAWVARRAERVALGLFGQETLDGPAVAADTKRVDDAETVRTLYVAMTRARRRVVLAGRQPGSAGRPVGAHAQFVEARAAVAAARAGSDLEEWMRAAKSRGECWRDEDGARWVFPALDVEPAPRVARPERTAPLPGELSAESRRLAARRRSAGTRAARPVRAAASEGSAELAEWAAEARYGESEGEESVPATDFSSSDRLERAEARAVGTAIHAALESMSTGTAAHAALGSMSAGTATAAARDVLGNALAQWLPAGSSEAATRRALQLLEGFLAGPLFERAREIEAHVVARELPVLLPPGREGEAGAEESVPVGFLAGAIDLVYRDPATGEWVVADYKTDAVAPGRGLAEHAARHRAQGRVYVRAVREALALEQTPRFELWFLAPGEVVTLAL